MDQNNGHTPILNVAATRRSTDFFVGPHPDGHVLRIGSDPEELR
jgi:hypothetical protein